MPFKSIESKYTQRTLWTWLMLIPSTRCQLYRLFAIDRHRMHCVFSTRFCDPNLFSIIISVPQVNELTRILIYYSDLSRSSLKLRNVSIWSTFRVARSVFKREPENVNGSTCYKNSHISTSYSGSQPKHIYHHHHRVKGITSLAGDNSLKNSHSFDGL